MREKKAIVPLFQRGDIGGMAYSITNNIVNYLIVIATLSGVLGWPDEIVYGRVIPGMSIGLMLSGFYYAFMAYRLSKREMRSDVTALPSGVSTLPMFVILYGVIMPLHYALEDPEPGMVRSHCSLLSGRCGRILRRFHRPLDEEKNPEGCTARNRRRYRIHLDGDTGSI